MKQLSVFCVLFNNISVTFSLLTKVLLFSQVFNDWPSIHNPHTYVSTLITMATKKEFVQSLSPIESVHNSTFIELTHLPHSAANQTQPN